jgi:pimeloyl-ACP methyl ester carboxylesterase
MPYLVVENQRLFYTFKRGKPSFPSVVLLHGAGSNHLGWPAQLRRLPDFPVYALDLPGHGRSAGPGYNSIDEYADITAALFQTLDLDAVILVGHSMGGAIAQMTALRYQEMVAGLVLIGTGARLPVSDLIMNQTLSDFDAVVDFVAKYAWARGTPKLLINAGIKLMRDAGADVTYGDYLACHSFDVRELVGQIKVPTLVVGGSSDMMTPIKFSHFLADQIPQANLVTIEGGGHMMMLEQAEEVTAVITQFLEQWH